MACFLGERTLRFARDFASYEYAQVLEDTLEDSWPVLVLGEWLRVGTLVRPSAEFLDLAMVDEEALVD